MRLACATAVSDDVVHHLADGIYYDGLIGSEVCLVLLEKLLNFLPIIDLNDVYILQMGEVDTLYAIVKVEEKRFRRA